MLKGRKIPYISVIPVIFISFVLFRLVNNVENFVGWIKNFVFYLSSIVNYLICGICIAFLLNSPMMFFIKKFRFKKVLAIIIVYAILFGSLALLFASLIPMIFNSVSELLSAMPANFERAGVAIRNFLNERNEDWIITARRQVMDMLPQIQENVLKYLYTFLNENSISSITTAVTDASNAFFILMFGFVLSVYMLWDKEKLIEGIKRIIKGLFNEKAEQKILYFGTLANKVFSGFLIGKSLDSIIVLILCLICTSVLGIRYALIISLIVGITNMLPYFGPLIGWIASVLLSLFVSPIQALETAIIVIVLQQFDGLILGPKILSNQVGVSPILIIAGITIGGNLGGLPGMFLGVPIITLIKIILYDNWIDQRIRRKSANKAVNCDSGNSDRDSDSGSGDSYAGKSNAENRDTDNSGDENRDSGKSNAENRVNGKSNAENSDSGKSNAENSGSGGSDTGKSGDANSGSGDSDNG